MSDYRLTRRAYRALIVSKCTGLSLDDAIRVAVLIEKADEGKRDGLTPIQCRQRMKRDSEGK